MQEVANLCSKIGLKIKNASGPGFPSKIIKQSTKVVCSVSVAYPSLANYGPILHPNQLLEPVSPIISSQNVHNEENKSSFSLHDTARMFIDSLAVGDSDIFPDSMDSVWILLYGLHEFKLIDDCLTLIISHLNPAYKEARIVNYKGQQSLLLEFSNTRDAQIAFTFFKMSVPALTFIQGRWPILSLYVNNESLQTLPPFNGVVVMNLPNNCSVDVIKGLVQAHCSGGLYIHIEPPVVVSGSVCSFIRTSTLEDAELIALGLNKLPTRTSVIQAGVHPDSEKTHFDKSRDPYRNLKRCYVKEKQNQHSINELKSLFMSKKTSQRLHEMPPVNIPREIGFQAFPGHLNQMGQYRSQHQEADPRRFSSSKGFDNFPRNFGYRENETSRFENPIDYPKSQFYEGFDLRRKRSIPKQVYKEEPYIIDDDDDIIEMKQEDFQSKKEFKPLQRALGSFNQPETGYFSPIQEEPELRPKQEKNDPMDETNDSRGWPSHLEQHPAPDLKAILNKHSQYHSNSKLIPEKNLLNPPTPKVSQVVTPQGTYTVVTQVFMSNQNGDKGKIYPSVPPLQYQQEKNEPKYIANPTKPSQVHEQNHFRNLHERERIKLENGFPNVPRENQFNHPSHLITRDTQSHPNLRQGQIHLGQSQVLGIEQIPQRLINPFDRNSGHNHGQQFYNRHPSQKEQNFLENLNLTYLPRSNNGIGQNFRPNMNFHGNQNAVRAPTGAFPEPYQYFPPHEVPSSSVRNQNYLNFDGKPNFAYPGQNEPWRYQSGPVIPNINDKGVPYDPFLVKKEPQVQFNQRSLEVKYPPRKEEIGRNQTFEGPRKQFSPQNQVLYDSKKITPFKESIAMGHHQDTSQNSVENYSSSKIYDPFNRDSPKQRLEDVPNRQKPQSQMQIEEDFSQRVLDPRLTVKKTMSNNIPVEYSTINCSFNLKQEEKLNSQITKKSLPKKLDQPISGKQELPPTQINSSSLNTDSLHKPFSQQKDTATNGNSSINRPLSPKTKENNGTRAIEEETSLLTIRDKEIEGKLSLSQHDFESLIKKNLMGVSNLSKTKPPEVNSETLVTPDKKEIKQQNEENKVEIGVLVVLSQESDNEEQESQKKITVKSEVTNINIGIEAKTVLSDPRLPFISKDQIQKSKSVRAQNLPSSQVDSLKPKIEEIIENKKVQEEKNLNTQQSDEKEKTSFSLQTTQEPRQEEEKCNKNEVNIQSKMQLEFEKEKKKDEKQIIAPPEVKKGSEDKIKQSSPVRILPLEGVILTPKTKDKANKTSNVTTKKKSRFSNTLEEYQNEVQKSDQIVKMRETEISVRILEEEKAAHNQHFPSTDSSAPQEISSKTKEINPDHLQKDESEMRLEELLNKFRQQTNTLTNKNDEPPKDEHKNQTLQSELPQEGAVRGLNSSLEQEVVRENHELNTFPQEKQTDLAKQNFLPSIDSPGKIMNDNLGNEKLRLEGPVKPKPPQIHNTSLLNPIQEKPSFFEPCAFPYHQNYKYSKKNFPRVARRADPTKFKFAPERNFIKDFNFGIITNPNYYGFPAHFSHFEQPQGVPFNHNTIFESVERQAIIPRPPNKMNMHNKRPYEEIKYQESHYPYKRPPLPNKTNSQTRTDINLFSTTNFVQGYIDPDNTEISNYPDQVEISVIQPESHNIHNNSRKNNLGYDSENQKKLSFEELLESQEIYEPPGTPPCLPDEPPIDEEEEDIEDLPLTKKVIQDGREFNSAEVHGTIQNNIISAK